MPDERDRWVWLVEDEASDVERAVEVLERYSAVHREFDRAFEANAQIAGADGPLEGPRPALILLDWRLPGGGQSVLDTVRQTERFRATPVVVFSRSAVDSDIRTAFASGATAWVVKPDDIDEYEAKLTRTFDFFLAAAEPPLHHD